MAHLVLLPNGTWIPPATTLSEVTPMYFPSSVLILEIFREYVLDTTILEPVPGGSVKVFQSKPRRTSCTISHAEGKSNKYCFVFTEILRWFDDHEDDKLIERELAVNGTPGRPFVSYRITVLTGQERGKSEIEI